jgi:hypothetical protein
MPHGVRVVPSVWQATIATFVGGLAPVQLKATASPKAVITRL